ncbi:MAG: hypothetical protein HXL27_01050 [Prevotellaceae bacterium]|nr:hypothetical protein [Prevotellaceae bacterium]
MSQTTIPDPALRGFSACGCGCSKHQLNTYDYNSDIPGNNELSDLVEVQFKNTRKGYFRNDNHLDLQKGDVVAVEASPGHDIGTVTLTGSLVPLQMKKAQPKNAGEIKRVYRKARTSDIEKWHEARSRENDTMIQSRQIAKSLELDMKIGDVEYQGDCNKAIFYYIADSRVDFRKLIRVLADTFHVRVEMRQIGARQEAGRIGGIGPCGRELCCSTWMKNFQTVSTGAARQQDISPNPQKLAGQCGKLKCCLNYELDAYNEAHKSLPERNVPLETIDGTYYHFKADILSGQITYSTDKRMAANLVTVSAERALEVMEMNRGGEKPETLDNGAQPTEKKVVDLAEQDDLTRFDKSKKRKKRRPRPDNARQTAPEEGQEVGAPNARGGNARRDRAPRRNDDRNRERSGNRNDRNRNSRDAEARADQAKGNGRRDPTRPTPNGNSDNTPTA